MKILDLESGKPAVLSETDALACAVGNFDGVHRGHLALLRAAADAPLRSAVFSFVEPSSVKLSGAKLLTSPEMRLSLFREAGISLALLEDFEAVHACSPDKFASILFDVCHVRSVVCGFNFRYGKDAVGTPETLAAYFEKRGGTVQVLPAVLDAGVPVSASEIRRLVACGDMARAAALLGRPFSIEAPVLHGKALGRSLGFPTANQLFFEGCIAPRSGVYAVRATIDGVLYNGIADVGVRPTAEERGSLRCETYLFGVSASLYGKRMKTEFLAFLREERAFSDLASLRRAIEADVLAAEAFFASRK